MGGSGSQALFTVPSDSSFMAVVFHSRLVPFMFSHLSVLCDNWYFLGITSESNKTIYQKNSKAHTTSCSGNFILPMEEHEKWEEGQRFLPKF